MRRSQILAHRGWHRKNTDKNSREAITRALDNGFGIETDLRDCNQKIVISHDPPSGRDDYLSIDWLFCYLSKMRDHGKIALNIKSDGLAPLLKESFEAYRLKRDSIYAFDMSVPDALQYISHNISAYSRLSEYEGPPAYRKIMSGVWVDSFMGEYPQVQRAKELIKQGISVTIVSPELHGRCHEQLWLELRGSKLYSSPLLQLCTDLPDKAEMFFQGS